MQIAVSQTFVFLFCWQDYVDVQNPQLLLQEDAEYTETI